MAAAVAQQALRLVDGSTAAAVEQHTLWGGLESGRLGCSEAEAADRCDCLFARL
ncbi:hypothetical protein [Nesterenkonia pannonica]|uniref:hypothetical protein n=1 Tax=Nesterenkonia pannonica TaxID=1548602 RepID=UPI002164217D|nr:hypothetical protein [Nesterenkonia pannonica]